MTGASGHQGCTAASAGLFAGAGTTGNRCKLVRLGAGNQRTASVLYGGAVGCGLRRCQHGRPWRLAGAPCPSCLQPADIWAPPSTVEPRGPPPPSPTRSLPCGSVPVKPNRGTLSSRRCGRRAHSSQPAVHQVPPPRLCQWIVVRPRSASPTKWTIRTGLTSGGFRPPFSSFGVSGAH